MLQQVPDPSPMATDAGQAWELRQRECLDAAICGQIELSDHLFDGLQDDMIKYFNQAGLPDRERVAALKDVFELLGCVSEWRKEPQIQGVRWTIRIHHLLFSDLGQPESGLTH